MPLSGFDSVAELTGFPWRAEALHVKQFRNSFSMLGFAVTALALALAVSEAAAEESEKPKPAEKAAETQKRSPMETIEAFIESQKIDKSNQNWRLQLQQPPKPEFPSGDNYHWVLETNYGTMKIKLFHDTAPMHVASTVYLTKLGFYDGLSFHRVISDFMAQGGCPLGTGTGGPGYKYDGEFDASVRHDKRGLLSMANAGPGTDGSQFFITFVPTPHLDGNHTIFGQVTDGLEVLDELEKRGSGSGKPSEALGIRRATIEVGEAGQ